MAAVTAAAASPRWPPLVCGQRRLLCGHDDDADDDNAELESVQTRARRVHTLSANQRARARAHDVRRRRRPQAASLLVFAAAAAAAATTAAATAEKTSLIDRVAALPLALD